MNDQVSSLTATPDTRWKARRVVTELVSERFPAIKFHSQPAIAAIIETLPDRTWPHFRTCMINRYGPVPEEGIEEPYRDPEIYRDMQHERYHVLVADWHAYPHESMDHYCRRFQEAMLPHIPMDIPHPGLQTLVIMRNGLPPQIRQHTPIPMPIMTVAHMVGYILAAEVIAHDLQADAHVVEPEVPDDDVGIPEPVYEPEPAYEPEPVYEPEPAYEPEPVYEPEPAYEPGCDAPTSQARSTPYILVLYLKI
ncbi:hypothetical protein TIFTF001_042899 [Ficus carica]|uniref:Uncharacterized protein n=1 Tax=Ficus carica TaxID=3494 RepID=A0AA87YV24_FICCA|nr:hypothetical protein TIFTF001_042899 [Ficus carica]